MLVFLFHPASPTANTNQAINLEIWAVRWVESDSALCPFTEPCVVRVFLLHAWPKRLLSVFQSLSRNLRNSSVVSSNDDPRRGCYQSRDSIRALAKRYLVLKLLFHKARSIIRFGSAYRVKKSFFIKNPTCPHTLNRAWTHIPIAWVLHMMVSRRSPGILFSFQELQKCYSLIGPEPESKWVIQLFHLGSDLIWLVTFYQFSFKEYFLLLDQGRSVRPEASIRRWDCKHSLATNQGIRCNPGESKV